MTTIILQCNIVDTFKCLLQTDRRSADANLAKIHEEMSELLDKQVNV